jgi:hypothetical protein
MSEPNTVPETYDETFRRVMDELRRAIDRVEAWLAQSNHRCDALADRHDRLAERHDRAVRRG